MTAREDSVRNIAGIEVPVRVEETKRYDPYYYERWVHVVTVEGDLYDVMSDELVSKFAKPVEVKYMSGWCMWVGLAFVVTREPSKVVIEQLVCDGE